MRSLSSGLVYDMCSPPFLIRPIRRAHLALGDILCVPCFKAGALLLHRLRLAFLRLACCLRALLTEANGLDLVAFLRHNNVTFLRVRWRALGLVVAFDPCTL